ncbi:sulfite reductase, ferredoxin dependent [filamentous cyanobacterium LEGE 11480]|uniref:Sulfite reductase [ferredoxin] n=1 Tax=Romeriopsis navalis LEGE 11480 TaxID=2777977 RepID=A0A928VMC2_9CYAN|nr:sulfite reductase, ferredoxin dependent [Romeriopsis navalis]MBE9031191.1 sulfite reductase, ferredoxin dependent [Romeriopsis navalis LEGE 11480]
MVMTPDTPVKERKPSKVEGIKERSNFLREPVATELQNDSNFFTEEAIQLLKFHGSYQQDNRDNRTKGQEKDYRMMLRTRSPGGYIPPLLYLTLDHLSNEYGNGTIRATTRQGFQLHGILKKNLKPTIAAIVKSMGSTLGACGDLSRNVMSPPAPFRNNNEYEYAREYANRIADLLTPQTGAYYEIWLNGERHITAQEHPDVVAARRRETNGTVIPDSQEPIYGTHYMPRKFKACVTVPGDNSVDLFSQDLSLVVICDPNTKRLQGFNIYAGGGLGRTHNKEETFPRLADPIGYVEAADVYEAVKAIVATQRDHGDRSQRRHARMKYLIEDMGLEAFKAKVETYFGKSFQPMRELPPWKYYDFLGWHEQGDGKMFVGISVENGRVKDEGDFKLKSVLKRLVHTYRLPMLLTASQNIILFDINPSDKPAIAQALRDHGIKREDELPLLDRYAMACPALPMCGLATAEAERVMPSILERLTKLLKRVGLPKEHFITRMTGCPNGCARPYLAEVGFVGNGPDQYQLWLGACPNQTRLSRVYMEKMPGVDMEKILEPIFVCFKQNREKAESFGDFCNRYGFEALQQFSETYEPAPKRRRAPDHRRRVTVRDDIFGTLLDTAKERNKSMTDIVDEAIKAYLNIQVSPQSEPSSNPEMSGVNRNPSDLDQGTSHIGQGTPGMPSSIGGNTPAATPPEQNQPPSPPSFY